MWIDGRWFEEPEVIAYINRLKAERNAYKEELISTLQKATTCIMGDKTCDGCKYVNREGECPTQLRTYAAKLRLEELV